MSEPRRASGDWAEERPWQRSWLLERFFLNIETREEVPDVSHDDAAHRKDPVTSGRISSPDLVIYGP